MYYKSVNGYHYDVELLDRDRRQTRLMINDEWDYWVPNDTLEQMAEDAIVNYEYDKDEQCRPLEKWEVKQMAYDEAVDNCKE